MLKILLSAIAVLYAILSILAAGTQLRTEAKKDASVLMIVGGILICLAVVGEAMAQFSGWLIVLGGGACISAAAFLNGRRSGHFHPAHHIIRLGVTLLLTVGFYLL